MSPFTQTESFFPILSAVLDYAACGGADSGECLRTAEAIRDGDCESWYVGWIGLAERVRRQATLDLSGGRQTEAHNAFLRAAHYYRTAGHFLGRNPHDARIATTAEASGSCFARAMRLSSPVSETKGIDVGGIRHAANLYRCDDDPHPRTTVLVAGEAGTTLLELYFSCAVAANRCGWHCLTVSRDKSDPARALQALLTAAGGFAAVDPDCLALLIFGEEPASPLERGRYRWAIPQGMGSAQHLTEGLQRSAARAGQAAPNLFESSERFDDLGRFHQYLFRWLNSAT